jgi:methyltransferase (TIGR00027 family)
MSMTAVGLTSRWIAASRAMETESAEPLFSDAFARDLAGEPGFAMMATMRQAMAAAHFSGPDPYLSIRTKFLDDAVLAAVRESSLRQVVILAAGMDARAFRLDWPAGLTLFEVDREEVFQHKEPVLERLGARAHCDRRIVRADISGPWTAALAAAGFDAARPAAILVEGLLFYLDKATATAVLDALGMLAGEGSWIGMDLINREVLTTPYLTGYLNKLRELGCPWMFGLNDPEKVLAEYGWHATVVTPGEPAANYGRWVYPVIPRAMPGVPRTFLVCGRKTSEAVPARSDTIVDEPAAVATPIRYQLVREPDLVGSFACPEGSGPFPAVLALGGSDGGLPEYFTDLLVPEGFACLALGYFGMDGTQASLIEVPLERIERALRWLAAHPKVADADGRVGVVGASRGGEFALLAAATFRELVGPVVAYTPSHVVWAGIDYTAPGSARSSWSHAGKPLPYMPYVEGVLPSVSPRGLSLVAMTDRALDNADAVHDAAIPIERVTGPLLLISGGDDQVWAAARMCGMAVERMRAHGRAGDVRHLNYPDAGHGLFPYGGPSGVVPRPQMRLDLGGSVEAGKAAHADAWKQVVAHLKGE